LKKLEELTLSNNDFTSIPEDIFLEPPPEIEYTFNPVFEEIEVVEEFDIMPMDEFFFEPEYIEEVFVEEFIPVDVVMVDMLEELPPMEEVYMEEIVMEEMFTEEFTEEMQEEFIEEVFEDYNGELSPLRTGHCINCRYGDNLSVDHGCIGSQYAPPGKCLQFNAVDNKPERMCINCKHRHYDDNERLRCGHTMGYVDDNNTCLKFVLYDWNDNK